MTTSTMLIGVGVGLGAIAALIIFVTISDVWFARLVIVAMFVSRPAVDFAGLSVRPEILIGALSVARLMGDFIRPSSEPPKWRFLPSMLCVGAWVGVLVLSSYLSAPQLTKSLSLAVWLALNITTAVWLGLRCSDSVFARRFLRFGIKTSLVYSVLLVALWGLAAAGLPGVGVQPDPSYGGYAAYGFSIEANIAGGLVCLWGLVALKNPQCWVPWKLRAVALVLTPVAILATHTRAALVAFLVGLIALAMYGRVSKSILVLAGSFFVWLPALLSQFAGNDGGLSKFNQPFDVESGNGALRLNNSLAAINEWSESGSRLIGLGLNSFGQRNLDQTLPGQFLPGYIGNLPVQLIYDGGTLGFALALLALLVLLRSSVGLILRPWMFVLVLPYLLISLATSSLWLLQTWVFAGLAWAVVQGRLDGRRTLVGREGRAVESRL